MRRKAKWMIQNSVRTIIEGLEDRRLMSASLALVNQDGLPGSDRMVFNRVQIPDKLVTNVVHDTGVMRLRNVGDANLVISSIVLNGPWEFVNAPSANYAGTTVAPGASIDVTLRFTQSTLPPHSVNQTNFTADPNGGASIFGSMTINCNDPLRSAQQVTLAGWWQKRSENNNEANLTTIVNTIYGYKTKISDTYTVDLTQGATTKTIYGEEVESDAWTRANSSQSVSVRQIYAAHTQGNSVRTYWYGSSDNVSRILFTSLAAEGQTLLPHRGSVTGLPLSATFAPTTPFGFRVDNEYSTDSINLTKNSPSGGGHHFRFFPLRDSRGNLVANTYIMCMDYSVLQTKNFDFNDNVYLVSNIRPFAPTVVPPTPANLVATSGTNVVLNWDAVSISNLAGYRVYRSTSATGTFTQLTSGPQSGTTFTDTPPASGVEYFYQVTAVDTTGEESLPAMVVANTPSSPTGVADAFDAQAGTALVVNVLANDIDPEGDILPSTLVIVGNPSHGTASVDTSTGLITYTSTGGFNGTDTLTYQVSDSTSLTSGVTTVTFNVVAPEEATPTTLSDDLTALLATPTPLAVLDNDTSFATIDPATVAIVTAPTHGTAVANSDGTITYTPADGFVGADTLQYTVNSTAGKTSASTDVEIHVGVRIGSAKGLNKSVVHADKDGSNVTTKLNIGTADVFFRGNGSASIASGKVTVTGSSMQIDRINMTGTTKSSSLSMVLSNRFLVANVFGITSTGPLSSIVGTRVGIFGDVDVQGLASLKAFRMGDSEITIGASGASSAAIAMGENLDNVIIRSAVRIRSLTLKSFLNTGNGQPTVYAPAISSLVATGDFAANIELSGTGTTAATLGSAVIKGNLHNGFFNVTGKISKISAQTAASDWGASTDNTLSSLVVKSGGFNSEVTAATLSSLVATGDSSGTVNATTAKSIKLIGNLINGAVNVSGNLSSLVVTGAINNSTIKAGGNIGTVVAASMIDSTVSAGDLSISSTATISKVALKNKTTTAFSNSHITATTIKSASLGNIDANNSGTPFGLVAVTLKAISGIINTKAFAASGAKTANSGAFTTYLASKSIDPVDFRVTYQIFE